MKVTRADETVDWRRLFWKPCGACEDGTIDLGVGTVTCTSCDGYREVPADDLEPCDEPGCENGDIDTDDGPATCPVCEGTGVRP